MTESELREHLKAHVMRWAETGELLEAERRERVRNAATAESLLRLNSLFDSAVHLHPPAPTSGLVDFYDILAPAGELDPILAAEVGGRHGISPLSVDTANGRECPEARGLN